jgi:hypothetical protein
MTAEVANATKKTLQGEGRDDPSTTATALLALSEARAKGTHVSLGNTYPPPKKTIARKERARKIVNSKNNNVTVSAAGQSIAGTDPSGDKMRQKLAASLPENMPGSTKTGASWLCTKTHVVHYGARPSPDLQNGRNSPQREDPSSSKKLHVVATDAKK